MVFIIFTKSRKPIKMAKTVPDDNNQMAELCQQSSETLTCMQS